MKKKFLGICSSHDFFRHALRGREYFSYLTAAEGAITKIWTSSTQHLQQESQVDFLSSHRESLDWEIFHLGDKLLGGHEVAKLAPFPSHSQTSIFEIQTKRSRQHGIPQHDVKMPTHLSKTRKQWVFLFSVFAFNLRIREGNRWRGGGGRASTIYRP